MALLSMRNMVEDTLYACPQTPARVREKPMRVLAVGLSRSGTESLRRALYILGLEHVYHGFNVNDPEYPASDARAFVKLARRKFGGSGRSNPITRDDFEQVLATCDAVTDCPSATFAAELISAYPEAKVILNTRDEEAWHRSVISTFSHLPCTDHYRWIFFFHHRLYWTTHVFFETIYYPIFGGDIENNAIQAYRKHNEEVRRLTEPHRLLEWSLGDGWGPLCEFLEVEIPNEDFPKGNEGSGFHERIRDMKRFQRQQAYFNVGCIVGAVVCATAISLSWYKTISW